MYWIIALLVATLIYTAMGIVARELDAWWLTIIQQVFARILVWFFCMLPLLVKNISFKKYLSLPLKDYGCLLFKSTCWWLLWAWLFSWAVIETSFVSVSIILLLPLVALFGIIFNKDTLTPRNAAVLFMSLLGAFIVVTKWWWIWWFTLWFGEFLAFISAIGLALSYISRKRFSPSLNDFEITFWTMTLWLFIMWLLYLIEGWAIDRSNLWWRVWIFIFIGWVINIIWGVLKNYWASKVWDIASNILLNTEILWAVVFGYFIYSEVITWYEIVWWLLIFASSLLITYKKK